MCEIDPSLSSATDMPTSAALDVDVHDIAWTLDAILGSGNVLPQYGDLERDEAALSTFLVALLPAVQTATDRMDRGTPEWYRRQSTCDRTRKQWQRGLGDGLRSAHQQVVELAMCCRHLLAYYKADCERGTGQQRG